MSKTKLAEVPRCHRKPWPKMVEYPREKLAMAERGEIAGLALAIEYDDATTSYRTFHDERSTPIKLIGCMEVLSHEMREKEVARRHADD